MENQPRLPRAAAPTLDRHLSFPLLLIQEERRGKVTRQRTLVTEWPQLQRLRSAPEPRAGALGGPRSRPASARCAEKSQDAAEAPLVAAGGLGGESRRCRKTPGRGGPGGTKSGLRPRAGRGSALAAGKRSAPRLRQSWAAAAGGGDVPQPAATCAMKAPPRGLRREPRDPARQLPPRTADPALGSRDGAFLLALAVGTLT